eukprot:scaffold11985_cov112-Isochrysis_galbana.AAC.8
MKIGDQPGPWPSMVVQLSSPRPRRVNDKKTCARELARDLIDTGGCNAAQAAGSRCASCSQPGCLAGARISLGQLMRSRILLGQVRAAKNEVGEERA